MLSKEVRQQHRVLMQAAEGAAKDAQKAQSRIGMTDRMFRTKPWKDAQAATLAAEEARTTVEMFSLQPKLDAADQRAKQTAAWRQRSGQPGRIGPTS